MVLSLENRWTVQREGTVIGNVAHHRIRCVYGLICFHKPVASLFDLIE